MIATRVKVGSKGANEVATLVQVGLKCVTLLTTFGRYRLERHAIPKPIGKRCLDKPGRRRKNSLDSKCM